MALTKAQRDALPADDFAVPESRQLPIHDEKHVAMAWSQLDRTQGLTDAERQAARHRILDRAKALGMDTADWSTLKAMSLEAMSLNVPKTDGHPNKMPFTGILTRVDKPSDMAPHGSKGRRVMLPKTVAEACLHTLLGMAVDFTPDFDGHDAQKKIGLIDEATIEGDAVHIGGFIYAADFPDTAARIQRDKGLLGFSFEMKNVRVVDPGADPLVIESCVFTGAAILRKADAAYTSTSLAASTDRQTETIDMTKEELEAILAAALKPVTDDIATLKAGQTAIQTDLTASKEVQAKVSPHADALRACSASMSAAGVGAHATQGHAAILSRMADRMEAEAALGKVPHVYRDHDFISASAEPDSKIDPNGAVFKQVAAAISEPLTAQIAALQTTVTDLKAAAVKTSPEPERKSVSAETVAMLDKFGLKAGADGKIAVAQVDQTLEAAGIKGVKAMEAKLKLRSEGLLAG